MSGAELLEAVRGQPASGRLLYADVRALVETALFHGVGGYLRGSLGAVITGAVAAPTPDAIYLGNLVRHARTLEGLAAAGAALEMADIAWCVVKGPVLAERLHGDPGLRSYADIDLLVSAADFGLAASALEELGGVVLLPHWTHRWHRQAGEVSIQLPSGDVIDLHWHLINDRDVRARFRLDMGAIMGRTVEVTLGGQRVRTLSSEDTLLHLVTHSCMSGGDRLLWTKDIELACAVPDLDWEVFVQRAGEWRIGLVAAVQLDRAQRTLGADVPHEVIAELAGRHAWLALSRLSHRVHPTERSRGGRSLDRAILRATGSTSVASFGHLVAKSARSLMPRAAIGGRDDADEAARDRYLAWVARRE